MYQETQFLKKSCQKYIYSTGQMYSDTNIFLCCHIVGAKALLCRLFTISRTLTRIEITQRYLRLTTYKVSFICISLDKCIQTFHLYMYSLILKYLLNLFSMLLFYSYKDGARTKFIKTDEGKNYRSVKQRRFLI